jgi:hypothetical protein
MPILVTVFPALLKAQKSKKSLKIDKIYGNSQGGGRAQAQGFLWGLFFDKSL